MGGFLVYGCLLVARVGLRVFLHTESSKVQWKIHQLRFNWSWWVTTCSKDASLRIWNILAFSRAVPFGFSVCMAARESVSWWLLSFTLLCSSHNWVTLVGCWSFCVLMTPNRFHASCCKALGANDNIFLNCLSREEEKNVAFLSLRFMMRKLWPIVCSLR